MKQKNIFTAIAFILILATPETLFASAFEIYGSSSRGTSLGGAYTALADDGSATYYNMAGLIADKRIKSRLGFLYAQPYLKVNSHDHDISDFQGIVTDVSLPIPFAGGLENKVGFGFTMVLFGYPDITQPQAWRLKHKPSTSPRFVMFESMAERLIFIYGLAFELHPAFLIGAGTQFFIPFTGGLGAVESPTGSIEISGSVGMKSTFAPHYGIIFRPGELSDAFSRIQIGLSYRDEFKTTFSTPVSTVLGGVPISFGYPVVEKFTPREATVGIAGDITDNFTLSFDLGWENWSKYPASIPEAYFSIGLLGADLGGRTYIPREGFEDIWVPRIGAEYRYTSSPEFTWAFRGGYAYETRPSPMQISTTNLLTNDRHVFSLGMGVTVGGKYLANPVIIDIHVQDHYMYSRKHRKDPDQLPDDDLTLPGFQSNNPGYPTIVSSGHVFATGFSLTFTF